MLRVTVVVGALACGVLAVPAATAKQDTLADQMHRLRNCESGNDYRLNDHNRYFGAYQFAQGTWRGLGYPGRPDHASPATQDKAADKLHSQQGWKPWPYCSQHEHLH